MILVVDDDYDIAWSIKISLEKAGLRASFFTDPLIALDEFRSHSTDYDLMVSDIRMPAMDGCELAQKIKKIKPDVKILLMSAYEFDCSDRCFTKAFLHSVVAGFIEKPISLDKLRTIILTVLNNTKLSTSIMSTFYNNSVHVYSGNIAKKRTDFLICNKCLWCVSLYTNMDMSDIKCPVCDNNRNLESILISKNESFKIEISKNLGTGITLEFSRQ